MCRPLGAQRCPYVAEARIHFDDLELVRVMFRLEQQGRLGHITGVELMSDMGGQPGQDAERQGFVRLLLVAAEDGLISFQFQRLGNASAPNPQEYRFIADAINFRLLTRGRDRAIGREVVVGFPDPGQDDGRRLSQRLLSDVATAMGSDLEVHDAPTFLVESRVPQERCVAVAGQADAATYIHTVLLDLAGRGASGRRVVLHLIGNWLDDELDIAPTDQERRELLVRFARAGWKLDNSVLVLGEKVKPARGEPAAPPSDLVQPDPERARKVMVVYGRDSSASSAMFDFLRALKLDPQEWISLVHATENAAPYTGEVLDRALEIAQAVVVLFTPDDDARLRADLLLADDGPEERDLRGQPRPNVLYEAGLAMGRHPTRTVIVELGTLRGVSDLFGRHTIRLVGSAGPLHDLAERLRTAGCSVDTSGQHWRDPARFNLRRPAAEQEHPTGPPASTTIAVVAAGSSLMDELSGRAEKEPATVVVEAHRRLHESLTALVQQLPDADSLATVGAMTERAVGEGLITTEAANAIQGMTALANLNSSPGRHDEITPERAIDYLALVDPVIFTIHQPPPSGDSG
jgi:hypothetical protein